jgi:Na+:H+ antiporter, NhaA family
MKITALFKDFTQSEKTSGIILIICSAFSLIMANTPAGENYMHFWHSPFQGKAIEFWINDGLMTIFFLMVGLEIEREFYIGELSDIKRSLLPIFAAIGGMLVPALIHFSFNFGTDTQKGFGIPMATDIAFSLAVLSLLGNRVPISLKIFLTALAIIDDLGAILVIAIFYTKGFSLLHFGLAMGVFTALFILNRLKMHITWIYLVAGMFMWYFMYKSGIHPTITGVILAFVIPFGKGDKNSGSYILQHRLHIPVAFLIVPLFALANTAIRIESSVIGDFFSMNSIGIMGGLIIGKPLGISLLTYLGITAGWCSLPPGIRKSHLLGVGFLAGIGFTMSIFITLLAFNNPVVTDISKIAIISGSLIAGCAGFFILKFSLRKKVVAKKVPLQNNALK